VAVAKAASAIKTALTFADAEAFICSSRWLRLIPWTENPALAVIRRSVRSEANQPCARAESLAFEVFGCRLDPSQGRR
jgi:hypothetical protein